MTLFVSYQRDAAKDEIAPQDVCEVGTVVKITQIAKLPSNNLRVSVRGLYRARAEEIYEENGCFYANVSELKPVHGDPMLEEAYLRTAQDVMRDIASATYALPKRGWERSKRSPTPTSTSGRLSPYCISRTMSSRNFWKR